MAHRLLIARHQGSAFYGARASPPPRFVHRQFGEGGSGAGNESSTSICARSIRALSRGSPHCCPWSCCFKRCSTRSSNGGQSRRQPEEGRTRDRPSCGPVSVEPDSRGRATSDGSGRCHRAAPVGYSNQRLSVDAQDVQDQRVHCAFEFRRLISTIFGRNDERAGSGTREIRS